MDRAHEHAHPVPTATVFEDADDPQTDHLLEFPIYISIQRSILIKRQRSRAKLRRVSLVKSKTEIE